MQRRQPGSSNLEVSALGLGCMGPGYGYGPWHGAAATTAMSQIAIQEALDGTAVEWLEHVTDAEYGATL